jgi:hypothetical protein
MMRENLPFRTCLFAVAVCVGACQASWPQGLDLPDPVQSPLPDGTPAEFQANGARYVPKVAYEIEAVVLSTMRYRVGKHARVLPLDVALGWGPMSDGALLEKLRVRQNDRYFFWSMSGRCLCPAATSNTTRPIPT